MDQRDRLLELIRDLYAALGSVEGWQSFLDRLCSGVDGCGANFISHDLRSHRASIALTARTDPAAIRSYVEHWGMHDPWARSPHARTVGSNTVILGDELISHSAFKRTEYYAEFARPFDIVRCIAAVIETGPDVISVISINGTERRGPFGSQESALISGLMPHLHRGLQLHRRLAASEAATDGLARAMDRAAHAVLLVDRAGRVTYMNGVAEKMTKSRDGLAIHNRELHAARAEDTSQLRGLLADAAATTHGDGLGAGGVLVLGRPSGRRPLNVVVSPISRRPKSLVGEEPPVAVVMATDPERDDIPDEWMLSTLFTLTPAEAKLAHLLARGVTLEDAGSRLGLRTATVRTRLKSIFEKTDTHRQTELVRLLLNSTPGL